MFNVSLLLFSEGVDRMRDWLIGIVASENFWSSVISSAIGGLVAFFIAKYQVKKSQEDFEKKRLEDNKRYQIEQEQLKEKARQEIEESQKRIITFVEATAKRTRDMEFIKMQIKDCDDSIAALLKIPMIISKIEGLLNGIKESMLLGNEFKDDQNLFTELALELLRLSNDLVTTSKIAGLSEAVISNCEFIRGKTFLALGNVESNIVNEKVFIEEGKTISLYCGDLNRSFTERRETLIIEFGK